MALPQRPPALDDLYQPATLGQILRDQFLFLVRAGFDALEVVKQVDAEAFASSLARYTVFYQGAGDDRAPAMRRRLARLATPAPREMVR